MKKTKEKILDTSLKLFNTHGLSQITLRSIAKEMGISQGNLNYHYKKREDIIETLYYQLVKNIDDQMSKNQRAEISLNLLFDSSHVIMTNFYEYRFFLLDFAQIMREHKAIKTHYSKLIQLREEQFMDLFNLLITHHIMRAEELPNEYRFLYKRFQILGDFWISAAEVAKTKLNKKAIPEYAEIISQAIYPYLTTKGKQEYQTLTSL